MRTPSVWPHTLLLHMVLQRVCVCRLQEVLAVKRSSDGSQLDPVEKTSRSTGGSRGGRKMTSVRGCGPVQANVSYLAHSENGDTRPDGDSPPVADTVRLCSRDKEPRPRRDGNINMTTSHRLIRIELLM